MSDKCVSHSYRGALHSWLGTLAYSSTEGLGATLTPAECNELHGLLMLLDGPSVPLTVKTHDGDEPAILVAASWVKRIGSQQDWACQQCVPHSDCLVRGFRCYYHQALLRLHATNGST